jgi:kynurenine formamidase
MKFKTFAIGYVLALALFLFAQHRTEAAPPSAFRGVVDLTHSMQEQGRSGHVVTASTARRFAQPESLATHIAAPASLARGMWSVDQIPAERLIAPLVVLDVSASVSNNPDYQVSVEDIARWEQANGPIPLGSVVVARTGWDSHWKNVAHFAGYSADAAQFLVEGRDAIGLGSDTPSRQSAVYQYALAHSVYLLKNVANLDRVPASGAIAMVAPTKLPGAAEGPVRVMALVR